MRLMPLFLVLFLPCYALAQQSKTVTLYLDGAKVEVEEKVRQGYLEYPLPRGVLAGSLRVQAPDGTVRRVEVISRGVAGRASREEGRLEARRCELEDRLKALEVREEVFTAAARSQSGKSPRKSKNNPDPVGAMRQGTEYALGQLEGVYRARRKCEAELKELAGELSRVREQAEVAKVWLEGKRARLSWLTKGLSWSPSYTFLAAGTRRVEVVLHAKLPPAERGTRYLIAAGTVAAGAAPKDAASDYPVLSRYQIPLEKEEYAELPYPSLAISFKGGEGWWPPGEAAAFWRGAYVGSGRFAGGSQGELAFGK